MIQFVFGCSIELTKVVCEIKASRSVRFNVCVYGPQSRYMHQGSYVPTGQRTAAFFFAWSGSSEFPESLRTVQQNIPPRWTFDNSNNSQNDRTILCVRTEGTKFIPLALAILICALPVSSSYSWTLCDS